MIDQRNWDPSNREEKTKIVNIHFRIGMKCWPMVSMTGTEISRLWFVKLSHFRLPGNDPWIPFHLFSAEWLKRQSGPGRLLCRLSPIPANRCLPCLTRTPPTVFSTHAVIDSRKKKTCWEKSNLKQMFKLVTSSCSLVAYSQGLLLLWQLH